MTAPLSIHRWLTFARLQGAVLDLLAIGFLGAGAGAAFGHVRAGGLAGTAAGLLVATRWTRMRAALAVEQRRPELGSALEAYLEGHGGSLRPSLEAWVSGRMGPVLLRAGILRLGAALLVAAAATLVRVGRPPPSLEARPAAPLLVVTARVEPPPYTGWPAVEARLPTVRGLRGSRVHLDIRTHAPAVSWAEQDGALHEMAVDGGRATLSLVLDRSRSLRLAAGPGGPVALIELEALPDRPPEVTLEAPETDRTVTARPERFPLRAGARDDVAVAGLDFHWTLAQGHGEGMRFRSGRIPGGAVTPGEAVEARGSLDPVAVGMRAGDTLVVWAEARDGNPLDGPGQGRSEARILRWEESLVDFTGTAAAARLPPPPSRLTERELLARTGRLVRSGAQGAERRARSAELAEAQRQIREGFGFFLQAERGEGLELDVDDKELGESGDARARRLLARAVSEMWAAEGALAAGNPRGALPPERAAVQALDAAFGTERLALRALRPPDKPVDEGRRLTGGQSGLRPGAAAGPVQLGAGPPGVEALARRLLLASEQELGADAARGLADALWALPGAPGLPAAALAAPLYAADDAPSRAAAARAAAVALSRWLRPAPVALPPVSPEESALFARLPPVRR